MSIVQRLVEIFQSLFKPSSPDVMQKQVVKKIENDLRNLSPSIYKNGLVQISFAEALRQLFINTKPIEEILAETICSTDLDVQRHYEEQLLLTGFDAEDRDELISLNYENRKAGAMAADSVGRYFENEHRKLEKLVKKLNTQDFFKIDLVLDKIKQLNDICKYNYVTNIRLFDSSFSSSPDYVPKFQPLPTDLLETALLDMYYVVSGMDISTSLFNAVVALEKIRTHGSLNSKQIDSLKINFVRTQSLLKHYFSKEILWCLIRISKKDAEFVPSSAVYKGNSRQKYADLLEKRFRVDENRLKTEIQDATISSEIREIFGEIPLISVHGYSNELNNQLKHSTSCSFMWTLPMQILKTFVKRFYDDTIKPLLNDIVIEGFFNNPSYKSDFSSVVFACNELTEHFEAFEGLFNRGNDFDEANITGLIHDSHKDISFESNLKDIVDRVNKKAKEVLQEQTNVLYQLYKINNEILIESKKPSSDVITNLKVMMISSRNRDATESLENQNAQWKVFLEIMKNYVIIGNIEKK